MRRADGPVEMRGAGARDPDGARPSTLAPCQETQWEFMCALAPDDPARAFHVVVENRYVDGDLDLAALEGAFADVTARHDGLRLVLDTVAPDATVRILDRLDPPVEHLDLSGLADERQFEAIVELSFRENRRYFDLRRGPLWHAWVVRLARERYLVNACFSHVIADGWAPKVFAEDLLAAYGARTGCGPPPPGDALTFAEIHALQSRRFAALPERVRYWREHVTPRSGDPAGAPLLLANPGADLMARDVLDFWFEAEARRELRRVAWRARTTPMVALLAAYHLLLCLRAGTDRSVVNTAASGRPTERERRAFLQFAFDPYVATTVPAGGALGDMVLATSESMAGAIRNAISYKAIARAVNPDFDAQRPWPAFHLCDGDLVDAAFHDPYKSLSGLDVAQVYIPGVPPAGHGPGLLASTLSGRVARAWQERCGPGVLIHPGREGGRIRYNGELYPAASVRALLEQYLWVVEAFAWRPDLAIDALRAEFASRFPD